MQDRRAFVASLGAIAAGWATGNGAGSVVELAQAATRAVSTAADAPLGIQLYTVRAALARDFEGTLEQLAAIGYREVEFAGYHGRTAAQVRAVLDRLGLAAPSAHVPLDAIRDDWDRVAGEAAAVGHRWITLPWVQARAWTGDDWRRIAALLNDRGADAARRGLRVAYHNHDFELGGEPLPLEILFRDTDPALVDFELDVYWVLRGGSDPLAWLARRPRRVRMLHLKDTAGPPEHRMVDVGAGSIDFAALLHRAAEAGVRHHFVEHDNPADPLASARASFRHLAGLRNRAAP